MIRNEREYRITKAQADRFREAIAAHDTSPPRKSVHPKLRQAELAAMRAQLADLDRAVKAYETLKNGTKRLNGRLDDLGEILVQARTARGWSQRELADRLGLHMQKIQQYEASNYESASLTRIRDVARVLGAVGEVRVNMIELPDMAAFAIPKREPMEAKR